MSGTLPMFPLGKVLVPSAVVPLQIFEPRYRTMLADVMAGDQKFGVVLIERGSEVGGGDLRMNVGTMARVMGARPISDDRWLVVVVGLERIVVDRWLPDDPYPLAEVSKFPDEVGSGVNTEEWDALKSLSLQVLASLTELGEIVDGAKFVLGDEPSMGSFQLGGFGPFSDFDRQRVLSAPGVAGRCALLTDLLKDVAAVSKLRLESDEGAGGTRR